MGEHEAILPNALRAGGDPAANAAEMLVGSSAYDPSLAAIVDGESAISRGELESRALAVAGRLVAAGVEPGDRVAILLRREANAAAAFFGVLASGAVAVIVNELLQPRQIEHILSDSGARALVSAGEVTDRLTRPLDIDARMLNVAEMVEAEPASAVRPRPGDELAQIIYTSGSTGLPKGVMLSHDNLWAGMHAVIEYADIGPDDRIAALLPFSFDYGLNQLLCAVGAGACLVIERSPVPARIVRTVIAQEVSVLAAVPPLWLQLLGAKAFRSPVPSLRTMTNSGGRLPTDAVRALREAQPKARLFLMYGLTEAFRSTYLDPGRVDEKPGSIGQAIPGAEILVLDEDLELCDPGEEGQLIHCGPTVAMGYWNAPEETARVFRPDPRSASGAQVVFSGDLVTRDEDGDLFFVGRSDEMIKTLGYRVSPDEVAEVLYASGEVVEAVVTSEPDPMRGARIVAYVVLRRFGRLETVEAFVDRELPRYMRPARIEAREALPRTASGKHDAGALTQATR